MGILAATAASLYPTMLKAAGSGRSLTAVNAAASPHALAVGLASGWIITFVFQDAFLVRLP